MSDETYKNFSRDLIFEMIDRTKDASIYEKGDFNHGYVQSLYASLSLFQTQLDAFAIERRSIGWGDFDADEWFRLGADYWKTQGLRS